MDRRGKYGWIGTLTACLLFVIVQMEAVQETVKNRYRKYSKDRQEHDATEKGVGCSEQLPSIRMERINRSHPPKNHSCIQQRVQPREPFKVVITCYTNKQ